MTDIKTLEKKPVLSISLLSSNRKKTIKKCLNSLKPILEQLESELIIVDTGCDKETRDILLEYTDKVIEFEWCNDFSAARNAGLKLATGEWFMYIDDDEWFDDTSEIIEFFKSGEYKNYDVACYIQRNYLDYKETSYRDTWVSRMIRLNKETCFVSSIHECFYPIQGECKQIFSFVKHFGYIFDTEEEKYNHSERNVSLLLDMIEKEPQNVRWWEHLAQEYRFIKEYRKMEETCIQGEKITSQIISIQHNKARGTFYCGQLFVQIATSQYEKAKVTFNRAIKDTRNNTLTKARLYSFGAEIYMHEKEYALCEEYCMKYIEIYDKYNKDEKVKFLEGAIFYDDVFEILVRNSVYSWIICSQLKRNETSALKKYFSCMGWNEDSLVVNVELIPVLMDGMGIQEYDDFYVEVVRTLVSRKGPDKDVFEILMKKEKEEVEQFVKLAKIFSQVESDFWYMWYVKIRNIDFQYKEGNRFSKELLQQYYEKLLFSVIDIFQLDESVWEIAEEYQVNLEDIFLKISFNNWKKGIDTFCEDTGLDILEKRKQFLKRVKTKENIRYEYFLLKVTEAELVYGKGRESYEELRKLFCEFVEQSLDFYGSFYKFRAFEGEMELLPSSCQVAVYMNQALRAEETEGWKKAVEKYKKCLGIFVSLDKSINIYIELYMKEVKRKEEQKLQSTKVVSKEMQELAFQIKEKIYFLMEQDKLQEAFDVLQQLKQFMPIDSEMETIESEIIEKLS